MRNPHPLRRPSPRAVLRACRVAALVATAPLAYSEARAQSIAQLPRDTVALPPAPTTCTRTVEPGGNLQQAIRRAKGGDVICLTPGGAYGPITLVPHNDDGVVTIRTAAPDSAFAAEGGRVRPSKAAALARITTPNAEPAIRTQPGANGWRLVGLEVTAEPNVVALVTLGAAGPPQVDLEAVPHHIILDRMWIHGRPDQNVRRCIGMHTAYTAVVNSWLDDCHEKGNDAQAIWGAGGPGPFRIENNTLIGSTENVLFGGADPAIQGLIPSDITIVRNHIYTPIAWKGVWLKKTLVELKNAARVRIEANVMDGSWAHGQVGYGIVMKSTNQAKKCPWCMTKDVTLRHNLVENIGAGINIGGRESQFVDSVARRFYIVENLIENVNVGAYKGEARLLQIINGVQQAVVERNAFVSTGDVKQAVSLANSNSVFGLVMRDNVFTHGQYGFFAGGRGNGPNALDAAPGADVRGNTFIGANSGGGVGGGGGGGRGVFGRKGGGGGAGGGGQVRKRSMPGFSYAASVNYVPVYAATRRAVTQATDGVVVQP